MIVLFDSTVGMWELPIDVWFEIGMMYGRYDAYCAFATSLIPFHPKLISDQYCLRARQRLGKCVRFDDCEYWGLDGLMHRDGDLPARIVGSKEKEWYRYGQLHRDGDLPAFISRKTEMWYTNGRMIKKVKKYDSEYLYSSTSTDGVELTNRYMVRDRYAVRTIR